MKSIVMFVFVLCLIRIGARLAMIVRADYPRGVRWSRAEDVRSVIFSIAFAAWCGWALLGP